MKEQTSIIGRIYYPNDNSYAVCLNDRKNHGLAGTIVSMPKRCKIVSNVFTVKNALPDNPDRRLAFVIVETEDGNTHSVMYSSARVVLEGQNEQDLVAYIEKTKEPKQTGYLGIGL